MGVYYFVYNSEEYKNGNLSLIFIGAKLSRSEQLTYCKRTCELLNWDRKEVQILNDGNSSHDERINGNGKHTCFVCYDHDEGIDMIEPILTARLPLVCCCPWMADLEDLEAGKPIEPDDKVSIPPDDEIYIRRLKYLDDYKASMQIVNDY